METEIEKLSEYEFALVFEKALKESWQDPIKNFVEARKFLGITLGIGQKVALKCILGQKLDGTVKYPVRIEATKPDGSFDLTEEFLTERELFSRMTDLRYDEAQVFPKSEVSMICGRRAGKTLMASVLSLWSAIKLNWKKYLGRKKVAEVFVIAQHRDFAQDVLREIKHLIDGSEILRRLKDPEGSDSQSAVNLKVPFIENGKIVYSFVQVKVFAASKQSTRGPACVAALLDECAFYDLDENAAVSDKDIVRAVQPALAQFGNMGLLILLSSPSIRQGVLWENYEKRLSPIKNKLVLKAASWMWNEMITSEKYREFEAADPDSFEHEYRGNFVDSISIFIRPDCIDQCVKEKVYEIEPSKEIKDLVVIGAIDAAFKKDKFAFSIIGMSEDGRVKHFVMKTWAGTKEKPVSSMDIAEEIAPYYRKFGLSGIFADQYSFEPLRELFSQQGMTLTERPFTNEYKKKIFYNLKNSIHQGHIELLDNKLLILELKQLVAEIKPTGTITLGHPARGSDDLADALAIAVYEASQQNGSGNIDMGEMAGPLYDIPVDSRTGQAFVGPSFEMLAEKIGISAVDNSSEFETDPVTGETRRISDDDDDDSDDGSNFII